MLNHNPLLFDALVAEHRRRLEDAAERHLTHARPRRDRDRRRRRWRRPG